MPTIVQQLANSISGVKSAAISSTQWIDSALSSTVGAIAGDVISSIPSLSSELLNNYWPDNYELYDCIIQIVDPETLIPVAQFDFTVMPESMDIPHKFRTQVIPTLSRNFILDSIYEAPTNFTLKGNFGVNHKFVLNESSKSGTLDIDMTNQNWINTHFVTGYGLCKRLEKIVILSHGHNGNSIPYQTFLLTRAFNAAIQVEINQVTFRQTVQKNRIWQYDLNFTKIQDKEVGIPEEKLINRLTSKVLTSVVSNSLMPTFNGVMSYIVKYI